MKTRSENTRKAYESDIVQWKGYAKLCGLRSFPVAQKAVVSYVESMTAHGFTPATIRRRCSALVRWHRDRGRRPPDTSEALRSLPSSQPNKKRALSGTLVRHMLDGIDLDSQYGPRDRIILLTGLATGMRRSELAAMEWGHVIEETEGVVIHIPYSKGDQEGEGQFVAIPFIEEGDVCPASELLAWREYSTTSSVFDCVAKTINRIVKRHVARIGLDPDDFGGNSFRSGFATEARQSGAFLEEISVQTRHQMQAGVSEYVQGYVQQAQCMENRAVKGVLSRLQEGKKRRR